MLVGIHVDPFGEFVTFLKRYEQILDYNSINHVRMDINDLDFWDKVKQLDLFIFRWQHIPDHHNLANTIYPLSKKYYVLSVSLTQIRGGIMMTKSGNIIYLNKIISPSLKVGFSGIKKRLYSG